jgi:uncharacterized protein DUF2380
VKCQRIETNWKELQMKQTSHSALPPKFDHQQPSSTKSELISAGRELLGFSFSCVFILFVMLLSLGAPQAAESTPATPAIVKIAVFDFELEDSSAGGGVIAQDPYDRLYLTQATEMAKRLLVGSGRYSLIDTKGATTEAAQAHGIRNCGGCEAPLAQKLGGEQAMIGIVNRISRAEFTVLIRVIDARSGAIVSNNFTNLRMGASDSWPRGVKWLMNKHVLAAQAEK